MCKLDQILDKKTVLKVFQFMYFQSSGHFFSPLVIFSVIWFSIFSVLWIRSNVPARKEVIALVSVSQSIELGYRLIHNKLQVDIFKNIITFILLLREQLIAGGALVIPDQWMGSGARKF